MSVFSFGNFTEEEINRELEWKIRDVSSVFWKKIDENLVDKRKNLFSDSAITLTQAIGKLNAKLYKVAKENDLRKQVTCFQDNKIIQISLVPHSITTYIDKEKGTFSISAPHISTGQFDYQQWKDALQFIQDCMNIDLSPLEKKVKIIKEKFYLNQKNVLIVSNSIKSLCETIFSKKDWKYQINHKALESEIIFETSSQQFFYVSIYHKPFINNASILLNFINNPHEEEIVDIARCQLLQGNISEMEKAIKESFSRIKFESGVNLI